MEPGGRVILFEVVVSSQDERPLAKLLDLLLLVHFPGRERTEAEHTELLASEGLKINRIVPTPGPESFIEAVRA
jgi:hypothetical protein